jgi:hypothetical protein
MVRDSRGQLGPFRDKLFYSAGIPLLRTWRKNALARLVLEMRTHGRARRQDSAPIERHGS